MEQFDTLLEAQVVIEDWRIDYNINRPHSSLGMLAPADYAARLDRAHHRGPADAVLAGGLRD